MMPKRKLLDQVSDIARFRHLSLRTEETYRNWIKRFILFHRKRSGRQTKAATSRRTANLDARFVAGPLAMPLDGKLDELIYDLRKRYSRRFPHLGKTRHVG